MKLYLSLLYLWAFCAVCAAQPWSWELYPDDVYNPTGFPGNTAFSQTAAIGDFDGNGTDDFFSLTGNGFVVATRDSQRFHWTSNFGLLQFGNPRGTIAMDLDNDLIDELIVFSDTFHAWKTNGTSPWTWIQRDDLLSDLFCPANTIKGIYGDYDSDHLLEGVFWVGNVNGANIFVYKRNLLGSWDSVTAYNTEGWSVNALYDGDFDHDGDIDFAVMGRPTDTPQFCMFGENTPNGIIPHFQSSFQNCGIAGGDLDGDGDWEALFLGGDNSLGYDMVHVESLNDSLDFFQTTSHYHLGTAPAPVFGTFQTLSGPKLAAVHGWTYGDPFPTMDAFECIVPTDSGWTPLRNGFSNVQDYRFFRGSMADLNNDGRQDILAELVMHDFMTERYCWGIWKNIGTADQDTFSFLWSRVDYFSSHFINRSDTVFTSPQIGDVMGDGRAQLAVLARTGNQTSHVQFYAVQGSIEDTALVRDTSLSRGLAMSFNKIRLADIDNDGLCELIGFNTAWHVFFHRNGIWQEENINLPSTGTGDISFADLNGDGTLDLFSTSHVWLNRHPSTTNARDNVMTGFSLLSAYPNPFNSTTCISFTLPQAGAVKLTCYDILGREMDVLAQAVYTAGPHSVHWDASHYSTGVYFVRASYGNQQQVHKLTLLK